MAESDLTVMPPLAWDSAAMGMPSVVIVGRANVGKSSLFNALCGERVSIVEPTAGVTRDRLSRVISAEDVAFELWDTGGIGLQDSQELADDIERQIRFAIDRADLVLFVVDGKAGRQPMDESIAEESVSYTHLRAHET